MAFQLNFDATQHSPAAGFEPLPSGTYPVTIIDSVEKPQQNTPGAFDYEIKMQIIEGPYKGRQITEWLHIKDPDEDRMKRAYGKLSAICHVTGTLNVGQSSQELHGKPFQIVVAKVARQDDPTRFSNFVNSYLDMAGNAPGKSGASAAQQATGQAFGQTAPAPATYGQAAAAAAPQAFAPQTAPAPTQQFAPQPTPAPVPAPQFAPQAAPAPQYAPHAASVQQYDPNQQPQQFASAPQFAQPAPQPVPAQGMPAATPDWAK